MVELEQIEFVALEDLTEPEPAWFVEDLFVDHGVNVLWGKPDTGKSVLTEDLALSVANELPSWHGLKLNRHGNVVYVTNQGLGVLTPRMKAWNEKHANQLSSRYRVLVTSQLTGPLHLPGWASPLVKALRSNEVRPVLIVLDNITSLSPGIDEVKSQHMTVVAAELRRLERESGAAVLALHHPPRKGQSSRGHGALVSEVDREVELRGAGKGAFQLLGTRSRLFEEPARVVSLRWPLGGKAPVLERVSGVLAETTSSKGEQAAIVILRALYAASGALLGSSALVGAATATGFTESTAEKGLTIAKEKKWVEQAAERKPYGLTALGREQVQVPTGQPVSLLPSLAYP